MASPETPQSHETFFVAGMKTSQEITGEFKTKLRTLLAEYGAELSAKDHWTGYAECGEDVRMTVEIPSIYDKDGNCLREWTDIDLGSFFQ